jgi:hypothetical protein
MSSVPRSELTQLADCAIKSHIWRMDAFDKRAPTSYDHSHIASYFVGADNGVHLQRLSAQPLVVQVAVRSPSNSLNSSKKLNKNFIQ